MITRTKKIKSSLVSFINPLRIIAQMEVAPGSVIVDFGCGAGFFSIPLSRVVGEKGKIYSLDVLPQALESVESQARLLGITNIITKRANLENEGGSGFKKESADWVIIKDMLYQNRKKEIILEEAYRILKPDGKALVVEWDADNIFIGPGKKLRVSTENLTKLIQKQKFSPEKSVKAGNFHYGLIISKKGK